MKSRDVSKDSVSIRPTAGTAGSGQRSSDGRTNPAAPALPYRSREKGREEWGLPPVESLRSLARTFLEQQAIHWPGLVGTRAVPTVTEATIDAMVAAFERRFRTQSIDLFDPAGVPARWRSLGGAYARFSDEGSNPRSLNQQLVNILTRARRDDVFIPWEYVCGDAAISGTLACRRGYLLLKAVVEQRCQTHVEWLVIDELSRTNRNVIESLRLNELVRRAGVRLVGASDSFDSASEQSKILLSMMATMHEMQIDQNASRVNRGMGDTFEQGRLVQPPGFGYQLVPFVDTNGRPVQTRKGTDAKRAEIDPEQAAWIVRAAEMIANEGKSPGDVAKLFNAEKVSGKATWSDIRVRRLFHRERLVGKEVFRKTKQLRDRETGHVDVVERDRDEWMERDVPHLRIPSDELAAAVKAKLGEGAKRFGKKAAELAAAARRPKGSTVKLEREIAKRERQIAIVNRNLEEMEGDAAIKSIIRKVAEMEQDLEYLRADLVAERRRNQSPPVTRVKEKDVLAELNRLRDVLLSDVGTAAPVLKALVGDVVIEARAVEGHAKPEMVARFTIDAVPAIAALRRGKAVGANDPTADLWEFLNADRWTMLGKAPRGRRDIVVPLRRTPKYEVMLPQIVEMAEAGEGFDRVARELKVSRGTVVLACDFASRDEAAAAARQGRKPTRPPHKWSEKSRAARRKPRGA